MTFIRPASHALAFGLGLWLATGAVGVRAEDKAPQPEKADSPELRWPAPSAAVKARAQEFSPVSRKKLQAAIDESNERLRKAYERILLEDMATKAVPQPFFEGDTVAPAAKAKQTDDKDARLARSTRGPAPADIERYKNLSDAGRDKLRKHFEENREKVMHMNPDERKAFMQKTFEQICKEDAAAASKTPAQPATDAAPQKPAPAPLPGESSPKRD